VGPRRGNRTRGALRQRAGAARGELADRNQPILRTHDRYGHRIDEVEYDPAYHGADEGRGRPRPALPHRGRTIAPARNVVRAAKTSVLDARARPYLARSR